MHRQRLISSLEAYRRSWASGLFAFETFSQDEASSALNNLQQFIESTSTCFERTHLAGHVTGSALVVTPELDRTLLTLHRKLGKWLQLGGHADGASDIAGVALREAEEESGMTKLSFLGYEAWLGLKAKEPVPFDIDIHAIPARGQEPEHWHFDVRYLIVAAEPDSIQVSDESEDLKWIPINEALSLTDERSMHRQFHKLNFLRACWKSVSVTR